MGKQIQRNRIGPEVHCLLKRPRQPCQPEWGEVAHYLRIKTRLNEGWQVVGLSLGEGGPLGRADDDVPVTLH